MAPESNINYQSLSYEELSLEFKNLCSIVVRTFLFISQMNDLLTFVDRISHKLAITRIYEGHKDLAGFSPRNIHKYPPIENPNIPCKAVIPVTIKVGLICYERVQNFIAGDGIVMKIKAANFELSGASDHV